MINESLQSAKHGSKHGSHGLKTLLAVFSKERRLPVRKLIVTRVFHENLGTTLLAQRSVRSVPESSRRAARAYST
jgi:hypothetical protein